MSATILPKIGVYNCHIAHLNDLILIKPKSIG